MEENEVVQEQGTPGQETEAQKKDKITKQHDAAIKFVTAIVGGSENLNPKRNLDTDGVAKVVAELFKEENEALEAKTKDELKNLLKKYVECEAEIKKSEKELEKLKLQKKKEFVEAVNKLRGVISEKSVMNETYAGALKAAHEVEDKD